MPAPHFRVALIPLILLMTAPAAAQDRQVPYWASLRADKVNMRTGPAEDYSIAWVYRRKQLPMKVLRLKEGWRLVEDPGGTKGWMLARFLTLDRGAIVAGKRPAEMLEKAGEGSRLLWRLAPGVVGRLGDCKAGWCGFELAGRKGFVRQEHLWGAGEP